MDKIAFLIPCYNEEMAIGEVIDAAKKALPEAMVYVYDNNSIDRTSEIAARHGAIVRKAPLQGKGNAVRQMFREVDAECYIMVDGDGTYDLTSAPAMARLVLEEKADMVIGDRLSGAYYRENKRPFHNAGNALVRFALNHLFHSKIKDIMTGCRAFSYLFVKTFPVLSRGFEIETEMTVNALDKNMNVRTLTIGYRDRPKGSASKLRTFRDGYRVLKTLFGFYRDYRPFRFFGSLSFVLFALATGFIVPIFIEYAASHAVPQFPTLICCCVTYLASLLFLSTGAILQTLRKKDLQDFERSLLLAEEGRKRKSDPAQTLK